MATVVQLPSGNFRTQIRRKNLATIGQVFKTREEAEAWGLAREAELVAAQNIGIAKPNAGMTFRMAVEDYFDNVDYDQKAASTQARERTSSRRPLQWLGSYAMSAIDGPLVQAYLNMRRKEKVRHKKGHELDKKVSADTVRLERAFLSAVFSHAKQNGYIRTNVMREGFKTAKCYPKEARISLDEQMRLYDAAEEMSKAHNANPCVLPWLYFVFETGTRPGEAAKIELAWVNFDERKISIPRKGSKKRNPRIILFGTEMLEMLRECEMNAYEAGSKFLFFSRANAPLEKNATGEPVRRRRSSKESAQRKCIPFSYYNAWRALKKAADIPENITPHIIRHEFISRLFEETDLNDSQIASLVGDVNVLSLEPYKHLRVEKLRQKQDAHLDGVRSALAALQKTAANQREFFARASASRAEAARERQARGDFSTPMDRIRAMQLAERLTERVASTGK